MEAKYYDLVLGKKDNQRCLKRDTINLEFFIIEMKEKSMQELVEELRENLFSNNKQYFHQILMNCFDQLDEKKNLLTGGEVLKHFNGAMTNLSFAMQDKDYLLVTDILKFEILPWLTHMEEE